MLRRTHEEAVRSIKIITAFEGDLGTAITGQKNSPLNYRLEFRDIASLEKLFLHHEEKTKIINITQQGSRYHLDPIEEETRNQI